MADLVTLAEAKLWLRVDDDEGDEDNLIALLIAAASEAVCTTADAWDGTGEVPARLKLACLTRVGAAYQNRESLAANGAGEIQLVSPFREVRI